MVLFLYSSNPVLSGVAEEGFVLPGLGGFAMQITEIQIASNTINAVLILIVFPCAENCSTDPQSCGYRISVALMRMLKGDPI